MSREAEIETMATAALCEAIKDRGNAMLAEGHTIEEVVAWAMAHGHRFHEIRERAVAMALDRAPHATCECQTHRSE